MVQMQQVDFGRIAQAYARHRPPYPEQLFTRFAELGVGVPGQRVVDLGTGTGSLARSLMRNNCLVTGVDSSPEIIDEAGRIDRELGSEIDYVVAPAENTGLADQYCDVVVAGQCWHWFDPVAAGAEAARILKPGGTLALANFDWVPRRGGVVEATEALIKRHNPDWAGGGRNGLYSRWIDQVYAAGFINSITFAFATIVPFTHEQWRGRVRSSAAVAGSLTPDAVRAVDEDMRDLLDTYFPREPVEALHRVFALVCRKPSAKSAR